MNLEDAALSRQVKLCTRNGLHARPAARLAKEMQRFASNVAIASDTGEAVAKSMLDILSLALAEDAVVAIKADGPDADQALEALQAFLEKPGD